MPRRSRRTSRPPSTAIRLSQRPASAATDAPDTATQIARINEISLIARTTWFGLLAYLAFVGITLLGVEDADFFVPSRQTQLPLIQVSIPTSAFFVFAPILGAALYAYLHLQLLKLWEALAAPQPRPNGRHLSDVIYPWLISDYAIALRPDGATRPRPLAYLSYMVTWALVWAAGPFVLAGFWWRSMPKHDEGLTLGIALALLVTLYIGLTSRWQACNLLWQTQKKSPWQGWFRRPLFAMLYLIVLTLSWARTEGGIDYRFNQIVTAWNQAMRDQPEQQVYRTCPDDPATASGKAAYCFFRNGEAKQDSELQEAVVRNLPFIWTLDEMTQAFETSWVGETIALIGDWQLFPRTDLAGVDLVPNPDNLLDHTTERRRFRKIWCERQGIDLEVCARLYTASEPPPDHLETRRLNWCEQPKRDIQPDMCAPWFDTLDAEFQSEWVQLWNSRISALGTLDLSGVDLRHANMNEAILIGVNLHSARMEGAKLLWARMEGANLGRARMESAELIGAWMERADLTGAQMKKANLSGAKMEGANLTGARMEQAKLIVARIEEANFTGAKIEGADLREARTEKARFHSADLTSAVLNETFANISVRAADLRSDSVTQEILNNVFGDMATKIPSHLIRPKHWDSKTQSRFDSFVADDPKFEAWLQNRENS